MEVDKKSSLNKNINNENTLKNNNNRITKTSVSNKLKNVSNLSISSGASQKIPNNNPEKLDNLSPQLEVLNGMLKKLEDEKNLMIKKKLKNFPLKQIKCDKEYFNINNKIKNTKEIIKDMEKKLTLLENHSSLSKVN